MQKGFVLQFALPEILISDTVFLPFHLKSFASAHVDFRSMRQLHAWWQNHICLFSKTFFSYFTIRKHKYQKRSHFITIPQQRHHLISNLPQNLVQSFQLSMLVCFLFLLLPDQLLFVLLYLPLHMRDYSQYFWKFLSQFDAYDVPVWHVACWFFFITYVETSIAQLVVSSCTIRYYRSSLSFQVFKPSTVKICFPRHLLYSPYKTVWVDFNYFLL